MKFKSEQVLEYTVTDEVYCKSSHRCPGWLSVSAHCDLCNINATLHSHRECLRLDLDYSMCITKCLISIEVIICCSSSSSSEDLTSQSTHYRSLLGWVLLSVNTKSVTCGHKLYQWLKAKMWDVWDAIVCCLCRVIYTDRNEVSISILSTLQFAWKSNKTHRQ